MNEERKETRACAEWEARLEDYLNGELNQTEAANVRSHIQACDGCGRAFASAQEAAGLLEGAERAQAPDFFATRVMARIREEAAAAEGAFWSPFEHFAARLAMTAGFATVALVGYSFMAGPTRQDTQAVVQTVQARDLVPDPAQPPADRDDVLLALTEKDNGR